MKLFLCLVSFAALAFGQGVPGVPGVPTPPAVPGLPDFPELPNISGMPELPDPAETAGYLSFIEDLPAPGEGLYRSTPFVEVVYKRGYELCAQAGFDSEQCRPFEWDLPFMPSELATEAERGIADAWFRFETRAYHRSLLDVGASWYPVACTLGGLDLFNLVFSGSLFVPPSEFCDDKTLTIFPDCFFSCDVNLFASRCPEPRGACQACIRERLLDAWQHAMTVYYPEYQAQVVSEVLTPLVALGALPWSGTPLLNDGGSLIMPVADPANAPLLIEDVAQRLIPEGLRLDPRAATYYTQTAAMDLGCRAALGVGSRAGLLRLPTENPYPEPLPGLYKLEELKRLLSSRESAGDTWKRTFAMLLTWDRTQLYPRYATPTGSLENLLFGEPARTGAGLPTQAACLGVAPFFEVYQKQDTVPIAHRPIVRHATCWVSYFPPVTGIVFAPLPPHVMVFAGPRFHTTWASVPEGFAIPNTRNRPQDQLRPKEIPAQGGE